MQKEEFISSLYAEMEKELGELQDEAYSLSSLRNISSTILSVLYRLKVYILQNEFEGKIEEIDFFKNIKPRFLSKLIYYQKIFEVQSRLPIGSSTEIKLYYLQEINKINEYLNDNRDFYNYYRSRSTALDEIYFIRMEPDSWLLLNFENYETDLNFTTIYDHKVAKILAYESLSNLINESISKLEIKSTPNINLPSGTTPIINWTASKASLIELIYALQSTGSCNNGTIDIKNLATYFENSFNIDLGNYYRVFQEIRIRKISRTTFLDHLKQRLIQRMDESDENPKFR